MNVPVAAGNEPFIHRGRTFVPLRVVSEALGHEVHWDGANFTVIIGESKGEVFLSEMKPYIVEGGGVLSRLRISYDAEANMVVGGQRYHNGMRFEGVVNDTYKASFALDAKYSQLTGQIGLDDRDRAAHIPRAMAVSFYGDGRLLTALSFEPTDFPRLTPVDINVTGVVVLRIEVANLGWGSGGVNLANMAVKK